MKLPGLMNDCSCYVGTTNAIGFAEVSLAAEPLGQQNFLLLSGDVPEITSSKRRPQLPLFALSELLGALV